MPTRESRLAALSQTKDSAPEDVLGRLIRAGALARRSTALGIERARLEQELTALDPGEVRAALGTERLRGVRSALLQAAEEAVEAALADDQEERRVWEHSAWEALDGRELLEALTRGAQLFGRARNLQFPEWTSALAELDRSLVAKWRWFVALNPQRRLERDLLDEAARTTSPWFCSRAECDGLIAALAGTPVDEQVPQHRQHVASCSECQRDLQRTSAVETLSSHHHLDSELLWRYDTGQLTRTERAHAERHATGCADCALALQNLADGDEAIAEAEREADEAQPARTASAPQAPAAAAGQAARRPQRRGIGAGAGVFSERSVITERREFRVVLVRQSNLRVLVQPLPGFRLAACAVQLGGDAPLHPKQTPDGFEFDLGPAPALEGRTGSVMVKLGETTEPIRCALEL